MSTAINMPHSLAATQTTPRTIPAPLATWLLVMLGLSSIVLVEPAPCDVLFAIGLPIALAAGYLAMPRNVNHLLYFGWFGFLIANLVSMIFCVSATRATWYLAVNVYMIASWFVYVAVTGRYGRAAYDVIFKAYSAAAVLTAAAGSLAYFKLVPYTEIFFRDEFNMRLKSTFKDPNVFAPFLVGAVIITLANVMSKGRLSLTQSAMLFVYFFGIVLAFSRGALIHLFVSLAVFVGITLLVARQRKAFYAMLTRVIPLLAIGTVLVVVLLSQTDLLSFFKDRMTMHGYDDERFGMQQLAFKVISDYPLGMGPGQWFRGRFPRDVHNLYLRIWSENGVLAVISLILFMATWIHCCWRAICRRTDFMMIYIACFAIVIGILVESIVIDTIHWRHFFLFLAIPIGLAAYESTTDRSAAQDDSE